MNHLERQRIVSLLLADEWSELARTLPLEDTSSYDELGYYALIMAHYKLGDSTTAIRLGQEGRRRFPHAPGIPDRMMIPMLRAGYHRESIELWHDAKATLRPKTHPDAMANLVGNTLYAYAHAGRVAEGIDALGNEVDNWESPLLYGNAACLYALEGQATVALHWMEKALALGKPVQFFIDDPDFDKIRHLPRFRELLKLPAEKPASVLWRRNLAVEVAGATSLAALFWIIERRNRLAGES